MSDAAGGAGGGAVSGAGEWCRRGAVAGGTASSAEGAAHQQAVCAKSRAGPDPALAVGKREVRADHVAPHAPGALVVEAFRVEGALYAEALDHGDAHRGERVELSVGQLARRGAEAIGVDVAVHAILFGEARPHLRIAECVRKQLVEHAVGAVVRRHAPLPVEESVGAVRTVARRADLLDVADLRILEQRVDQSREQARLPAEVVGHQRPVHPGHLGDGRHGQLGVAALGEDVLRGGEDAPGGRRQVRRVQLRAARASRGQGITARHTTIGQNSPRRTG